MEVMTFYIAAAVLFVLGLAVVGGALFGRKRKQRLLLVAASAILWGSALLLYGCTPTVSRTETPLTPVAVIETVTVIPETATATPVLETATATLVPTAPPSPLLPSPSHTVPAGDGPASARAAGHRRCAKRRRRVWPKRAARRWRGRQAALPDSNG